jgi:hypothetical protein
MKNIDDYIVIIEGAITHALCDAVLEEFKTEEEWAKTVVGHAGNVNDKVRTAETVVISYPHVIEKNPKVRQKLDKYIFASAGLAIKKYNNKREKILGFAQELINKENDQEKIKKIYELALFIQKNTPLNICYYL